MYPEVLLGGWRTAETAAAERRDGVVAHARMPVERAVGGRVVDSRQAARASSRGADRPVTWRRRTRSLDGPSTGRRRRCRSEEEELSGSCRRRRRRTSARWA